MINDTQFQNELEPQKPISSFLNVLTILTFIGCVFGLVSAGYNYITVCDKQVEFEAGLLGESSVGAVKNLLASAQQLLTISCDYKVPLFSLGLIGIAFCLFGAIQMRKGKLIGFFSYIVGELLIPIFSIYISYQYIGTFYVVSTLFIPVLMIILYFSQIKQFNK